MNEMEWNGMEFRAARLKREALELISEWVELRYEVATPDKSAMLDEWKSKIFLIH